MARTFPESLSLAVPFGTTWEEAWTLEDEDGQPLDLAGYEFRMMLRDKRTDALILTIDSTDIQPRAAIQPIEGGVPQLGLIRITVSADDTGELTPADPRRPLRAVWDAELYRPDDGLRPVYVIPVLAGSVTFQPRRTRPVPE